MSASLSGPLSNQLHLEWHSHSSQGTLRIPLANSVLAPKPARFLCVFQPDFFMLAARSGPDGHSATPEEDHGSLEDLSLPVAKLQVTTSWRPPEVSVGGDPTGWKVLAWRNDDRLRDFWGSLLSDFHPGLEMHRFSRFWTGPINCTSEAPHLPQDRRLGMV